MDGTARRLATRPLQIRLSCAQALSSPYFVSYLPLPTAVGDLPKLPPAALSEEEPDEEDEDRGGGLFGATTQRSASLSQVFHTKKEGAR